jgi:integrase
MIAHTLRGALENYLLYHDLAAGSVDWYRRIVSVFCGWAGRDVPVAEFNGEQISRLILAKQAAGRSPYYLRSLRNGLVALMHDLRGDGPRERVRGVRCPPLDPDGWSAEDVSLLLSRGCASMPPASRDKWRLCIELAYYTGLDRADIENLEQKHFAANGALLYRRRKTGQPVSGGVPLDLLAKIRQLPRGPVCRMGITPEWFRRVFSGIVARSGLFGTFKKLRKSSGSSVERLEPGRGHKHLGNTRAIFERHYEVRRLSQAGPTLPERLR